MENSFVDEARLDQLGAHFKFRDLTKRLQTVINEHRSEKRSKDLLNYQAYFTTNEQPQKLYVGPRQKLIQAQLQAQKDQEADPAVRQQQERQRKADQIREPNVSIERQPHQSQKGQKSPSKDADVSKIIGQSFTIQNQDDYSSSKEKTLRQDKVSSRIALADKISQQKQPLDTRISLSSVGNQIMQQPQRQPQQSQPHVVNLNANQLNLVLVESSHQSTGQKKQNYGQMAVEKTTRQSQQFTDISHEESRNLRQRHASMDEIQSDYKSVRPYPFAQQPHNHQSLSKMLGSQTRLQRNEITKKVIDKYSTTQNFQNQVQSQPKRSFHKQAKGLTIDSSQSPHTLGKFNIGQVRAASVMEQQSEDARMVLDKQKRPRVQERLMPVSTTHAKFYESEYGGNSMMGKSLKGQDILNATGKKLPVKVNRANILPKV